jgi:hypothetical protein
MEIPTYFSKWKERFAFFPHRCCVSNKLIWFTFGYRCNSYVFSRLSQTYWRDKKVHVTELLKGNTAPYRSRYNAINLFGGK